MCGGGVAWCAHERVGKRRQRQRCTRRAARLLAPLGLLVRLRPARIRILLLRPHLLLAAARVRQRRARQPRRQRRRHTVSRAARVSMTEGFAAHGDEIVVTAGVPFGQAGTTNALRVATVK